ncbi:PTS sugar transporter subunit IIB [Listeria booriae]|uniref:PTS sugar transporter subunit IIB n=1 Tax=Listeria booriae TaxID=1552123 RepID=UPI0016276116|nr:PTS sugar transporter subunit IIB [Listeria booriae]MBC2675820.1 PTS sugar transporter subunit IIB [Listeria booriae]
MNQIRILLCCGAGMSSGLLAQKARKAAKKRGLEATIEARSESEAGQYFSTIDVLMLGPHYVHLQEEMKALGKPYGVPVVVIPQSIYGMLDGEQLLDLAMESVQIKE